MSRALIAVLLAVLFIAPALLTLAPAAAGFVAEAVAAGSEVYIQPTNKKFYIDPQQTVIFTVTSSANAFTNNAQLYYNIVDINKNIVGSWYTWVTPVNLFETGVSGYSIRGPTVSLNQLLPPLVFLRSSTDLASLATDNDYGVVATDDTNAGFTDPAFFRLTDIMQDTVKDAPLLVPVDASSYYSDYLSALGGANSFSNLQPEAVQGYIDTNGNVWITGGLGTYIPVYRPGDTAEFIAEFPDPAEGQNVTVSLYLDQVDNSPEARINGYGPGNRSVSLTLPSQIPMGLHVVIAVADYGDYYMTAFTFIYVVPKATFQPFLISADPGATVTVTMAGLPMNATVDFFLAYNDFSTTGNYYVFDIAGTADTASASQQGSLTATFELLGILTSPPPANTGDYDTPNVGYSASGIQPADLGALSVDFSSGIQQIANSTNLPAGVTNYLMYPGVLVASRPSVATDPATWGEERLVIVSVSGTDTDGDLQPDDSLSATDIINNYLGVSPPIPVPVVSDYSRITIAVFNLPANVPFNVYMGIKASDAPEAHQLVQVANARTSSYGSALITFTVPELPAVVTAPATPYVIVVETATQPSIIAYKGNYGSTPNPVPALVQIVPAIVANEVGDTGFKVKVGPNWYIAEGVPIYFKITGLDPNSINFIVQDNTAYLGIEFVGAVFTNEYGTAEFYVRAIGDQNGTTGNTVEVTLYTYLGGLTIFTYNTVGPVMVQSINAVPGTGAIVRFDMTLDIWVGEGRLGLATTPDTVEITLENMVPGAAYLVTIEGTSYRKIITADALGTSTVSIPFTSAIFPGYGLYIMNVTDAQTRTIGFTSHVLLIATTTAPGSQPGAGIAAYSTATRTYGYTVDVPAGATGGLLIVGWNFSSGEQLSVGLQGISEAPVTILTGTGTIPLYGIDDYGVVVVDAISSGLAAAGLTNLDLPAGSYQAYIKRQYTSALNATQMWVTYNVYPTVQIAPASQVVDKTVTAYSFEGGVIVVGTTKVTLAAVGSQISFTIRGLKPSTYYDVLITDVNGVPLTLGDRVASDEWGTATATITIPSYLQVKNAYRVAIAPIYNYGAMSFVDEIAPFDASSAVLGRSIIILEKNAIELDANVTPVIGGWLDDWTERAAELEDGLSWSLTNWYVALDNVGFLTVGAAANETIEITVVGFNNLAADRDWWIDVNDDGINDTPADVFLYNFITDISHLFKATVRLTVAPFEGEAYTIEVPATIKIAQENLGTQTAPDYEYVAIIRFKMPSLPEEILNLEAPYRVFGVEFKLTATYYYDDGGTAQNALTAESMWIPVGGFAILVGAGSLVPVETILGKLSNIEAGIAAVQTTLGTVLAKLDGVQATLTEIRDDYLVVMLDNQGQMLENQQQILIKLDDLSELIGQTGEDIKLEIQRVESNIIGRIDGAYMDIVGNQQQILQLLDTINATLVEVSDGVAYIATTVGTIQVGVEDLQTLVADAADAIIMKLDEEVIVAIQQNGETLAQIKASIDALQPVITGIADGVAEIQTTLGTVQASIDELKQLNMEIKGMVEENGQLLVEINTSVGTIRTTLDALQGLVENQVVTGIGNIQTELQALGETGQQILAAAQAIQEQTAKIDDVRSGIADLKESVTGINNKVDQAKTEITNSVNTAKEEVVGTIGQKIEQLRQDIQQQTQQASEQAQQASGTAQTWGIINAVLSLAVLAAAGYLILQVRGQAS